VDPRTGSPPSDGPASVTVVAPTAAEADALSTAFYLLGREAAARYCAGRPGLGVLFVLEGNGDDHPRVWSCGLSPTDFAVDPEVATTV
jgi:thiamine biosynthesis lipoprotein